MIAATRHQKATVAITVASSASYSVVGSTGVSCLGPFSDPLESQGASPRLRDRSSACCPRLRAFPLLRVTGRGAGLMRGFSPGQLPIHPPSTCLNYTTSPDGTGGWEPYCGGR